MAETLDQQQTTYNETLDPYAYGGGRRDICQSFVAGYSGKLTKVSLYCIGSPGNYPVHVSIYADNGSNQMTGSSLADDNNTSSPGTSLVWFDFGFDAPANLLEGTKYWLYFYSEGNSSYYSSFGANSAGGYGSGTIGWFDFISEWYTDADKDLCFKTYMDETYTTSTSSTSGSTSVSSTSMSVSTSSTSSSTSRSISTSSTSSSTSRSISTSSTSNSSSTSRSISTSSTSSTSSSTSCSTSSSTSSTSSSTSTSTTLPPDPRTRATGHIIIHQGKLIINKDAKWMKVTKDGPRFKVIK